jgi:excinuclease UvrABC ATPase subunit
VSRGVFIEIVGARENNLRGVSLRIPRRKLVAFTGVSGSGKSSLVFDTIAAEAQRQLNETFSSFVRNRLPKLGQPAVDAIENLSTAIVIGQQRLGGNARSTVGTITDIYALLRLLFSRAGEPRLGDSSAFFSFNDAAGMCPRCSGIGRVVTPDVDAFLDLDRSLVEGAIRLPGYSNGQWFYRQYADIGVFNPDTPLRTWSAAEREALIHGGEAARRLSARVPRDYQGLLERFTRIYINTDSDLSERKQAVVERFTTSVVCPDCNGERLNPAARSVRVAGHTITACTAIEAADLIEVIRRVEAPAVAPVVRGLVERLSALVDIGLGYLSLGRATTTLSGGESQRIKMVRHLGSSLTETLYVFDEPSIGLHPRDVERLNRLLRKLRDKGNTVLVVEHDRDVIDTADHVVELGPGAGTAGGQIVFQGSVAQLARARTLTARHLRRARPLKSSFRVPTGALRVAGATRNNLKDVTVDIPTGVLTVVTGVAGSGKSTLVNDVFLAQHPDAVAIDQAAVTGSRRSNPATYAGIMDHIRRLFAAATGASASLFSFNSEGACPACQGLGVVYTDLAFMEGVKTGCEVCEGRRFRPEVLRHRLRGRSIDEVLNMTTAEALAFFQGPREGELRPVLRALNDVGLGYLRLGQPLTTLSGGEAQRIKLANELHKVGSVYVMDEPTTGLHMADVGQLLAIIDGLVDRGNSVVVIEHNLDVIASADWVIDLGPGAGHHGGQVLFTGTPAGLLKSTGSITAKYLRRHAARARRGERAPALQAQARRLRAAR